MTRKQLSILIHRLFDLVGSDPVTHDFFVYEGLINGSRADIVSLRYLQRMSSKQLVSTIWCVCFLASRPDYDTPLDIDRIMSTLSDEFKSLVVVSQFERVYDFNSIEVFVVDGVATELHHGKVDGQITTWPNRPDSKRSLYDESTAITSRGHELLVVSPQFFEEYYWSDENFNDTPSHEVVTSKILRNRLKH